MNLGAPEPAMSLSNGVSNLRPGILVDYTPTTQLRFADQEIAPAS